MPAGVEVTVVDGFATIDFVDRSKRGPGLAALLEVCGPDLVQTLTREGPRRLYRVPEGNARAAGLLDVPAQPAPTAPDRRAPDDSWSRAELNAYAVSIGIESPEKLRSKEAVLNAIRHAG